MTQIAFKYLIVLITTCFCISSNSSANKFFVINTNDAGAGSLRQAITSANSTAGKDTVEFNISNIVSNYFEGAIPTRYAVIRLTTALPIITEAVFIDGSTQADLNTGIMAGRTVGVDNYVQPAINYPDVYIVPNYTLPSSDVGFTGNGISVNAVDVKIAGLAISGFGNRSTSQPTGVGHADISILRAASVRNINVEISHCFLSCDPRGNQPSPVIRVSKSAGMVILGNNDGGLIANNYIAHCGGYGIVFHGTIDNTSTAQPLKPSQNWLIEKNQVIDIGNSTLYLAGNGRAADGISLMNTLRCTVRYNYVADFEQIGIDMGHNTDDNLVENNTVTGLVKIIGSLPVAGIRVSFSSQRDTLQKNKIFDNLGIGLGGIWLDESNTSFSGAVIKDNFDHLVLQNEVYNNLGSGIVLSNNGAGRLYNVTISQNSTYNNTGLGIDLNFIGTLGSVAITSNDNGDSDSGPNNLQNFPVIDSAKLVGTSFTVWGKGPATSTIEFFINDHGINKFPLFTLNYGEGKTFLASGVEGSAQDLAAGSASYVDIDGNAEATARFYQFNFILPAELAASLVSVDSLTSTATLNKSTSEFGPVAQHMIVLNCDLANFSGLYNAKKVMLSWSAVSDNNFRYFEIEHSTNGVNYNFVGIVAAASFNQMSGYHYQHSTPSPDNNYYRLKLVNNDGQYTYTYVTLVKVKQLPAISVNTNLASGQVNVNIKALRETTAELRVVHISGRMMSVQRQHLSAGNNVITVQDVERFNNGAYIIQLIIDGETFNEKLIVHR